MLSTDLLREIIQNFTIIVTLLLLYNFVPERILSRSKLTYSLWVGSLLGIAAILAMPLLWEDTDAAILGFNVILIPLAGFLGGPVSSVIVATALLGGGAAFTGGLVIQNLITLVSAVLVGTLFFSAREKSWLPGSFVLQYLLLGIAVVIVELTGFLAVFLARSPLSEPFSIPFLAELAPFFLISIAVTVILGGIITFIDRRKQAEHELLDYQNELEIRVNAKTAELRKEIALRKAAFDATADGIIVVDGEGDIRAYNNKAMSMFGLPPELQGGKPEAPRVFADIAVSRLEEPGSFFCTLAALPEDAEQVVTSDLRFRDGRIYEIFVQPEKIGEQIMGRVFSIRDITEYRLAEEAIRTANNKLVLLSDITRHDILNQLMVVSAYLHLLEDTLTDPEDKRRIGVMKNSLEVMRLQIEFTRDYHEIGLNKPVWANVREVFSRASDSFTGTVSFRCDTGEREIFADPLIERVFYNLIDNSLRHGERVTEIRLSARETDRELMLIYEDNGAGVPDDEKEKIFDKGFGKHTGLGMFLIREILSITGTTIVENGTPGQGARFEIRIPAGKFRPVS